MEVSLFLETLDLFDIEVDHSTPPPDMFLTCGGESHFMQSTEGQTWIAPLAIEDVCTAFGISVEAFFAGARAIGKLRREQ